MPATPTDPRLMYSLDLSVLPSGHGRHGGTISSEDVCRTVFLSSRDAILLLSSTGSEFLDLNPQACHMFGYTRQEFLSRPPTRTICVEKGQWESLLDSVSQRRGKWLRGMACRHRSGRIIVRDILPSLVSIEGRVCILATVRDATHRELSEVLRFNSRFARFSNAIAVGAAQTPDIEHAIRFCLQQVCDYAHWVFAHARIFSNEIVATNTPVDTWHFGLHRAAKLVRAMFEAKRLGFPENWYSGVLLTDRAFFVEGLESKLAFAAELKNRDVYLKSALVVPIPVGKEIIGVCQYFSSEPMNRDPVFLDTISHLAGRLGHIIEHKRAQDAMSSLSTRLFHAQEDERRNLARELHDTTAQNVTAALMDLAVIGNVKTLPSNARNAVSECMSLMRRALQELRTLSYVLHPPLLDELGLASALRIFVEGFSQRSGIQVRLDLPEPCPRFSKELEMTLFRVVQEGLTNAQRHSGSATGDIRLKLEACELKLTVENETTSEIPSRKTGVQHCNLGVGMRSMQERVERLGGHLFLDVGKNRTALQASFPLAEIARATGA
jgi:PAS domain S-box-containing protein